MKNALERDLEELEAEEEKGVETPGVEDSLKELGLCLCLYPCPLKEELR